MYRKWLLLAGVVDLFILSLLDRIAFQHYLYWRFAWFDVLMHLIGGLAIGLVSAYVYWEWQKEDLSRRIKIESEIDPNYLNWKIFFIFNLSFILIIGLGWEIFEILADRVVHFDLLNIIRDLFFGIMGSLLTGLFVIWIHKQNIKKLK